MHDSVAAIRANRSRARFILPPAHRRERRLGLHRLSQTAAARPVPVTQPLRALRAAARGLDVTATRPQAPAVAALRREPRMRWATDERTGTPPWRA